MAASCVSGFAQAAQTKSGDCLHIAVVPRSLDPNADPSEWVLPAGKGRLHLVLSNQCSADITAYYLDVRSSPDNERLYHQGRDAIGCLNENSACHRKILLAGQHFSSDVVVPMKEGESEPRFEGSIKATPLVFADDTAVGDRAEIQGTFDCRKLQIPNETAELDFLGRVSHWEDAKKILSQEPDDTVSFAVRGYWKMISGDVGNDPLRWAKYINWRIGESQSRIELHRAHSEPKNQDSDAEMIADNTVLFSKLSLSRTQPFATSWEFGSVQDIVEEFPGHRGTSVLQSKQERARPK